MNLRSVLDAQRESWRDRALCAQVGGDFWFPEGGPGRDAKRICNGDPAAGTAPCPVKAQCLEYAVANGEHWGVWGGTGEKERRRIRKGAA